MIGKLSKENTEVTIDEIRQNLQTRIMQLSQLKGIGSSKFNYYDQPNQIHAYMNARWSWNFFNITIDNLIDMWGFIQVIVEGLDEFEQEDKLSKEQVHKLNEQFKKYSPILKGFKEALEESKRVRERFR